tara:strand:- start:265 stop:516 length:252 start_codon:yes stop_codon:yes gene_type:complete
MITKQAIRKGVIIECNGIVLTKEEIITKGENWSEQTENFFRKMLKQGGRFTLKGDNFIIFSPEQLLNSKGDVEPVIRDDEDEE